MVFYCISFIIHEIAKDQFKVPIYSCILIYSKLFALHADFFFFKCRCQFTFSLIKRTTDKNPLIGGQNMFNNACLNIGRILFTTVNILHKFSEIFEKLMLKICIKTLDLNEALACSTDLDEA